MKKKIIITPTSPLNLPLSILTAMAQLVRRREGKRRGRREFIFFLSKEPGMMFMMRLRAW